MTQKFVMGVPLYRQEQEWNRSGIQLSRQTMSNWLIRATEDWLEPMYDMLHEILCNHSVLHADETTLQVLREPGKMAQSKSYMWLYRTSGDALHPIILYDYQPDRRSKRPAEFLKDFKGYLHTDGYDGYHSLRNDITVVGCWAHYPRYMIIRGDSMHLTKSKRCGMIHWVIFHILMKRIECKKKYVCTHIGSTCEVVTKLLNDLTDEELVRLPAAKLRF